ncbi:MAG: outer membrane beta-barrel protein [Proteobacteria bacterium]|nr:outer membrane beta-barrel protein [Pseudomonadota bacterium]
MKKLALGLLTAGAVTMAHADANTWTGFYLGVHGGMGSTTGKEKYEGANGAITLTASKDVGKSNLIGGLHTGYGMVFGGNGYAGAELFFGFDNTKLKYDDASSASVRYFGSQLKRSHYYGVGVKLGYLFSPSVLGYVRLAGEFGKWSYTVNTFHNTTGAEMFKTTRSKNGVYFSPGLGLETALTKNVLFRLEYTYTFVPKISVDTQSSGNALADGLKSNIKPTQQAFKVGVSYKF